MATKTLVEGICKDTKCFYDTYTSEYIDETFATKDDLEDIYTKTEVDENFLDKDSAEETYLSKVEANNTYYTKTNTYTKNEVNNLLPKIAYGTSLPPSVTNGQIFLLYR